MSEEAQFAADTLDATVRRLAGDVDELGDIFARLSVLVERVVSLQESLVARLDELEKPDSPE